MLGSKDPAVEGNEAQAMVELAGSRELKSMLAFMDAQKGGKASLPL